MKNKPNGQPDVLYVGTRLNGEWNSAGEAEIIVSPEGKPVYKLDPEESLKVRNHSPTGFSWGYGGSGPAQLALAILLDYLKDEMKAQKYYMGFKWRAVAKWPADKAWQIWGSQIDKILEEVDKDNGHLQQTKEG